MEIDFEWHTTKISITAEKKKSVEEELTKKIKQHYGQIIKTPASKLLVSLFDDRPGYLLTGAAVSVEGDTKKEAIKKITYVPGIDLEFIPQ